MSDCEWASERLARSFERIAGALEGLNETYRRSFEKQYPERGAVREAVVTTVPTEEERLREAQQGSDELFGDREGWEEEVGTREREWIEAQKRIAGA